MITEKEFGGYLNLEKLGFEYCEDYEYYGAVYKMYLNDGITHVNLSLINNSYHGLSCFICFDKIEKLSNFLINKYDIKINRGVYRPITLGSSSIVNPSDEVLLFYNNLKDDKIHLKPENVQEVADMVYEYLTEVYQPFWEKYSSLQVVNDEIIEKVEHSKITDYIPFFAPFKKLMIMKMCNSSKYEEFMSWLYGALNDRNNQGLSTEYFQAIVELKDILENGKLEDYA